MTRKQMISTLRGMNFGTVIGSKGDEALRMAIDALEQEPTDDATLKDIFCTGCEYKEQQPCDTISRHSAITAILAYDGKSAQIKAIDDLPSVQPSRKGHWIDYSDEGFVECPFCEHATNCEDNIDELHYCFYCGAELSADMRGDTE